MKTNELETEGGVERGQISAQDESNFPLNYNLHSGEGKRGDKRVLRSFLGTMGVWDAIGPVPWTDSR